ncbi:2-hydroxy-3-keto-5-methylthiopentenyl-1-phosphate phosphatase [Bacillus taeanensis]|uniref:2-hydroxy-3-keto-5-methylthiopentenyl-1-phosphate phosphatase n=1 Tax=Bacillus taeanensis TaxID=273032 RepID=A0A366XXJ8_9BACI|nr:2-hydroxy-3-keto-5-methylthiopentenyl-1-phosphate phosphatase [Bacillus taeanensis]RBW69509.1 2-hydroxy-3-keto-5-methylthiopentenyl-1-phosphate phosphatase [Bacillus taeanensis]
MKKPVIFCDFDGTITKKDNIVMLMKQFAPPEWDELKDKVLSQEISIQQGVGKMFSLLPTSKKQEITNYVLEHAEIREGFEEFVAYTNKQSIPLYIVSGGIDFFVKPMLESFEINGNIYCNESDFTGEKIKIIWPHSCDEHCDNDCGCCKPSIIRQFDSENYERIVIGDSITDLAGAKLADHVLAREFLLEKCQSLNLPHTSFETFFDVIAYLEKRKAGVL